ncbi:S-adenosyl-L-methionine-dependent methyltransferase superfamily protein [Forsythia ovata]|uniref:S-adenosyl-L-methionine-dependent methyltransferase superfamily protein n=1 Tax=Forsythia ovata TaxID=205694 RepID=A0ABD1QR18_9LAMI
MKQEPPPSPPLHHRHHRKRRAALVLKKFTKPTAYFVLLILSFFLGYLSAPSSSSKKPTLTSRIPLETIPATFNSAAAVPVADHNSFSIQCVDPVKSEKVRQTVLDRVFHGKSPWQNFPPAHVSTLLRQNRIRGWGSTGAVFENLIRRVRPRTIIEVGTFLGASALHMTKLTRQLGLKTQILCIDDFRGWPGFLDKFKDIKMVNGDVLLMYQFMQNVFYANATESVLFMPFSTGSALDKLCEWGVFAELIEVDAGHDFHSAWTDINKAYKILRPGGVIFGHDYFTSADNKGVRRAVNLFARLNNLRVQLDGQHWVIHSN